MILKMVHNLLLAWMYLGRDVLANNIELDAMTAGLPLEVKVRIAIRSLQPEVFSPGHSISN